MNTAPFDLVLATGQSVLVLCSAVTHLNNPITDKKNKAEGIFQQRLKVDFMATNPLGLVLALCTSH